jgi:predicted AAA+ superfamily ATPase
MVWSTVHTQSGSVPGYTRRIVDAHLDVQLHGLPAIAIEGARGVGKTATALQRAQHVLRLDDPDTRQVIEADFRQLEPGPGCILIDEWQRLPATWDYVRRAVDDGASEGRFLLTGSATPPRSPVHTGAGRIVSVRLRPMSLTERGFQEPSVGLTDLLADGTCSIEGATSRGLSDYVEEIVASGLPGIRRIEPMLRTDQLDGYLDHALDHDVTAAGRAVRRPQTLRRWLAAYAAATASTASYNAILDAATPGEANKPARSSIEAYREALTQLWLLDPVPGWIPHDNALEQLTQAPKHHLADPALAARILGLTPERLLGRSPGRAAGPKPTAMLGPLFESLATLSIRVYAGASRARTSHLRTAGGRREVDLVIERDDGAVLLVEVKLSATVDDADVRSMTSVHHELGERVLDRVVVTTGSRAYRRTDGVAVVPLALLGP